MLLTQLNQLFVYIPHGSSKEFIEKYSQSKEYKQKIVFVEDTKEIYTNGKAFGTAAAEFEQLVQLAKDNKDRLDILQGSAETEGSVKQQISDVNQQLLNKLDELKELVFGVTDTDTLNKNLDTIKEIAEWIEQAGADTIPQMQEQIQENAEAIAAETERAEQAESDLEARVKAIEDIEIWMTYESDSVPETEDTVHASSVDDINNIADPTSADVVVDNQDALGYFTDPANANTTFKNISI